MENSRTALMHLAQPPAEAAMPPETIPLSASQKTAFRALAMDDERCVKERQELVARDQQLVKAIEATQIRRLEIVAEIEAQHNVSQLATDWQFNGDSFFRRTYIRPEPRD